MREITGNHTKLSRLAVFLLAFFIFYPLSVMHSPLLFAEDKIIAIVDKDIITQKDLNDFINFTRIQLSAQYQGKQLENKIESMKKDLLDKLIEDRVILQEAKKEGIQLNPERIKEKIDEIKNHYGSYTEFQEAIAKQGLVEADIEARIRDQSLMYAVIDKEIRSKIIIKPAEITDFYHANTKSFVLPEQWEFQSMTINSESLANEIIKQYKSGLTLEDIGNKYSIMIDSFRSVRGGQLRKDIEDTLFRLKIGQISSPIKIENNYYIFRLNSIIPPRQQSLTEVQDDIQAMLYNKKMQESLAKWLDKLKSQSYIKIM